MNKAYLVLEDGRVYNATIKGMDVNTIGKVTLRNNTVSLAHQGGALNFEIEEKVKDFSEVNGKLVIDKLPVEYHLYDLKTAI